MGTVYTVRLTDIRAWSSSRMNQTSTRPQHAVSFPQQYGVKQSLMSGLTTELKRDGTKCLRNRFMFDGRRDHATRGGETHDIIGNCRRDPRIYREPDTADLCSSRTNESPIVIFEIRVILLWTKRENYSTPIVV